MSKFINKTWFVRFCINAGEETKPGVQLVSAPNRDIASDYAIFINAEDGLSLEWNTDGCMEASGQFGYEPVSVDEVSESEVEVLKKFLTIEAVNYKALHMSGSYSEGGHYAEFITKDDYQIGLEALLEEMHPDFELGLQEDLNTRIEEAYLSDTSVFELITELTKA